MLGGTVLSSSGIEQTSADARLLICESSVCVDGLRLEIKTSSPCRTRANGHSTSRALQRGTFWKVVAMTALGEQNDTS